MRTLIINSMFANALYRRCADELGKISDMELTMFTVDEWKMNGKVMPFDEIETGSPYKTAIGRAGWKGFENRGFYRKGLVKAFKVGRPEVLFLMEEPFSVFAAEILAVKSIVAPDIPVVFFTWNNLSLDVFDYRPSVFYRNVARLTLPRMDYALTANLAGIEVLRNKGFRKPIKAIGYGVDTQVYSGERPDRVSELKQELRIPEKSAVIGFVGRLIHMKGVDLLIDAVSRIKNADPNRELTLLLLGGGEEEATLLAMAEAHGLSDVLRHVKVVPQKDVADYMHLLDLLVLPSRRVKMWAEQFGRVLVEAMAAGKIVIGSSSGAIPEVIGKAGFVFEENNSADLASNLRQALDLDEASRLKLSEEAKERASTVHSWKRFASDAFNAIQEVHYLKRSK